MRITCLALSAIAADPKPKPIPGLKDAQDRYNAALTKAKKEHAIVSVGAQNGSSADLVMS